jgi:hypothetical protein
LNTLPDENLLTRGRLCELAEVERAGHSRRQSRDLLTRRRRYGLLDVLQAAQLDELDRALGSRAAAAVWPQVRSDLGVAGRRLEVVVNLSTLSARLARTDTELSAALPRGERAMVVDLAARSARARERFAAFARAAAADPAAAEHPGEAAAHRIA